ncbi:MAG: hypothetical protein S4CHLAM45_08520 [Chlamydiales bacterium]|nr:hypothetical protein [Chlamydiales bacterium]MCH9620398.1 hypothetical protein [Chlamydiales bacterium]MCH9622956.1 hypothetical protein [Chlamydiales bacterium]
MGSSSTPSSSSSSGQPVDPNAFTPNEDEKETKALRQEQAKAASEIKSTLDKLFGEGGDILMILANVLLNAVRVTGHSSITQAKVVKAGTNLVISMNRGLKDLKPLAVPNPAPGETSQQTKAIMQQVEAINQGKSIYRQGIQGEVMGVNQQVKLGMTRAQTIVNNMQQLSAQISHIFKMAYSISKQINNKVGGRG